jgi:hypothetical protein
MDMFYDLDGKEITQAGSVPPEWLALAPAVMVVAVVALMLLRGRRRRAFWCALVGREVVAEFRHGMVRSCTAFEDPTAVACARRCADATFRRQWPSALPVIMTPPGSGRVV